MKVVFKLAKVNNIRKRKKKKKKKKGGGQVL